MSSKTQSSRRSINARVSQKATSAELRKISTYLRNEKKLLELNKYLANEKKFTDQIYKAIGSEITKTLVRHLMDSIKNNEFDVFDIIAYIID